MKTKKINLYLFFINQNGKNNRRWKEFIVDVDHKGFKGKLLAKFETVILGLYDNPRPRSSKKLSGNWSEWRARAPGQGYFLTI